MIKARRAIELSGLTVLLAVSTFLDAAAASFEVEGVDMTIAGESGPFEVAVDVRTVEPGLSLVQLTLSAKHAARLPPLSVKWSVPASDIAGKWTPSHRERYFLHADWSSESLESMLTRHAPVLMLFGYDERNRYTVAVGDALNPLALSARIREEDARIYGAVDLPMEGQQATHEYKVQIRFDRRPLPFFTVLREVSQWWAELPGYTPAAVPDAARAPMYSTWYSYHQNVEPAALLREVSLAAAMGFEAIIVDDGWQTKDSNRGYAFTGDWRPERLTDMKAFVDAVHERGMKAILWYSLPFAGARSDAARRFEGKFLSFDAELQTYVLDPRYPEVREYLIEHYRRALRDWGWDGLKLDFIDEFRSDEHTVLEANDGRDYASVYEAVDRLMTDTITELRRIDPEVLIEFRQAYIGPLMRKYGNMFRASDIPNGAITNRSRITALRLLSGDTAVHSDMLMWHYEEPVEMAALQYLNVLFSVPQLSVRLEDIPADHLRMVEHYTRYWKANRSVLLDGSFAAKGIYENYSVLSGRTEKKTIIGLYSEHVVALPGTLTDEIDIVNAKASRQIIVSTDAAAGAYRFVTYTSTGERFESGEVRLGRDAVAFDVPPSGLLALERTKRRRT